MSGVAAASSASRSRLHPVLILLGLLLAAVALTHVVPAGRYDRHGKQVVPGSYHQVSKVDGLAALTSASVPVETERPARAAGVVSLFASIPAGMVKSAPLFFMVMFIGGTFGILRATGAVDAGVDRLLQLTSGNAYLLTVGLVVLLSCGSTFLGFSSEYVALVPVVSALGRRLGLPGLFAPAVVALADFIGYTTSVTNPIVLGVAQPMAGVPMFSGILPRLAVFVVFLTLGVGHLLLFLRRQPKVTHVADPARLTARHLGVLVSLAIGGLVLVVCTSLWSWGTPELTAAFVALGCGLAVAGGMQPGDAADAFLDGIRGMLLPCLLIGLAGSIAIILQSSQVVDTIVQGFADLLRGRARGIVGAGLLATEMGFGVMIPSAAAKAAVSLPILTPIARLSGIGGQVTVMALLLGSGMTNIITPTNPLLLAFLSAAKVDYVAWLRFVFPLFVAFTAVSFLTILLMTAVGM